jgi:hypothetical protein
MNISELLKRTEVKVLLSVVGLVVVSLILMSLLRKKDGFCRCNSIGSRVLCDEEHEKLKQLEGAL